MELQVIFIASLCPEQSFDSFTMQCILVLETTAIWETNPKSIKAETAKITPWQKLQMDGRTDRQTAFLYSRLAK